jgi:chromosome partitioning protein
MAEQTVIAIVNEKGGTGKTTTTVSLSAALGEMGQKVLLVDLDGQAASSRWVGVEEDPRLADAMLRGGGLEPIRNVLPNVSLAPASGKLDSVSHDLRPTQGGRLRKILNEQEEFDYVLIDCPPSLGNRLIGNALLAATHALVPVETSILALDGLKILLTTMEDIRDGFGRDIILAGVLACRYDARTRLSRMVLAELRRALPGRVFDTVIRENVRLRECPASGESIMTYATNCHAAEDYRALARELLAAPQAWRYSPTFEQAGEAADEYPLVDDLRSRASAKVREFTTKDETADDNTEATAPQIEQPDAELVAEGVASWEHPLGSHHGTEAPAVEPAENAAAADLLAPRAMEEGECFESWVARLGQAKERLEREKGEPLPGEEVPEPVVVEVGPSGLPRFEVSHADEETSTDDLSEADTSLDLDFAVDTETSQADAEASSGDPPAVSDAEPPAESDAETPAESDTETPAEVEAEVPVEESPEEESAVDPADDFPALRAALRRINGPENEGGKGRSGRPGWRKLFRKTSSTN